MSVASFIPSVDVTWKNARDLRDLCVCNIRWILGQINTHPCWLSDSDTYNLSAESKMIDKYLLLMNEHGLFTICSQPGNTGPEIKSENLATNDSICYQRAFVTGVTTKSLGKKLFEKLQGLPMLVVFGELTNFTGTGNNFVATIYPEDVRKDALKQRDEYYQDHKQLVDDQKEYEDAKKGYLLKLGTSEAETEECHDIHHSPTFNQMNKQTYVRFTLCDHVFNGKSTSFWDIIIKAIL